MTIPASPSQSTDVRSQALRMLTNGLYVLTVCTGDTLHAATISWVSQVSFQPPQVLAALRRNSHVAQAVRQAHRYVVNILGAEQGALAERFFDYAMVPAGSELFGGYPFRNSTGHCPLLTDALGWLECRLASESPTSGDHALMIGEVTEAGLRRKGTPLVLWNTQWSYGGISGDKT